MFLPSEHFNERMDRQDEKMDRQNERMAGQGADISHVRGKVDMLNDWHNTVDIKLERIEGRFNRQDEKLTWILRISMASLILSQLDKLGPNLMSAVTIIAKLFGV